MCVGSVGVDFVVEFVDGFIGVYEFFVFEGCVEWGWCDGNFCCGCCEWEVVEVG